MFPVELTYYGLTLELLDEAIEEASGSKWCLRGIPNVEFYRKLHYFLKRWSKTKAWSKTCIGKFYLSIDASLRERGSTPYNTYRFVDELVCSEIPDTSLMTYGEKKVAGLKAEIRDCHQHSLDVKVQQQVTEIQDCHQRYQELTVKVQQQQTELEGFKKAHQGFESALQELSQEKSALIKSQSSLQKKLDKVVVTSEATLEDLLAIEDELLEKSAEIADAKLQPVCVDDECLGQS